MNLTTSSPPDKAPISEGVVVLVFEAAGNGPSLTIRTRRLLKSALRAYGLRCLQVDLPQQREGQR